MTLEDVTIQLKTINTNISGLKSETVDTNEYLLLTADTITTKFDELLKSFESLEYLIDFFEGKSLKELEERREENAKNDRLIAALENLGNDTLEEKENEKEGVGLGGLLTGLAITLGTIGSVISAQIKAIKLFTTQFTNLVKLFFKAVTPKFITEGIAKATKNFSSSIVKQFKTLRTTLSTTIGNIGTAIKGTITSLFGSLAAQFNLLKTSIAQSKIFQGVKATVAAFFKPFAVAFKTLKDITGIATKVGGVFSGLSGTLKAFAGVFSKTLGIASKLFLPLTIIITLWDTVKGTIEGFSEEGIIGGIKGAVTGLFNSLIFGPLDLIKSAVSWVLGFFGFEKAEKILDSFSFEDTFTTIIDALFSPVEFVKNLINTIVNNFKEGGIVEILQSVYELFTSIVSAPLELIKNAVSWILGAFGFEEAEKLLDSFSFKETFTKIIDALFYPLEYLQNAIGNVSKFIKDKFGSVLSFFGISDNEENLQKEVNDAKLIEQETKTAGAVAVDPETGNIVTQTSFKDGKYSVEESERILEARGLKPLNGEERSRIEKQLAKNREQKELALKEMEESPKLADFIPSIDDITANLKNIGTSIWDSVTSVFDSITESIKEVDLSQFLSDAANIGINFFKNILKGILPSPDAMTIDMPSVDLGFTEIGGGKINLNPIPDSLYEFAGLNPKTGENISPPSNKKAEVLSSQMAMATNEQNQIKETVNNTNNIVNAPSTNNNIVNNSSTTNVYNPPPPPIRQPNSPSDTIWNAAAIAP